MTRLAAMLATFRGIVLGLCLGAMAAPVAGVAQAVQDAPAQNAQPAPPTVPPPAQARPPATTAPGTAALPTSAEGQPADLDLVAWEETANRTETALGEPTTTDASLDLLRAQMVDWREAFLVAQNTNSARIATLRQQIAALGPVPAEGQTEAVEIAARRAELGDQLNRLQAPGIAAEEAYRRADGLIREIDRVLRERQTDELLELLPSPINPANWPAAYGAMRAGVASIVREISIRTTLPAAREQLVDNLPAIVLLLALALVLIWRGRHVIEALIQRLMQQSSVRGLRIWALVLSLGQIVIPTFGVIALSVALLLSGMLGITGTVVADTLPVLGLVVFTIHWLGGRLFPKGEELHLLRLSVERRAEGRFLTTLYGLLLGLDGLRGAILEHQTLSEAARSVLGFPTLALAALLLYRMGRLLKLHAASEIAADEEASYGNRLVGLLGRGAIAIAVVGPVLGGLGYIAAASAVIYPAASSLGLLGLLVIVQVLVRDIYVLLTRSEDNGKNALVPVLIGFALVLASVPLFALLWGARVADLSELWNRSREGFQFGETRISPTNFLVFAVLFTVGLLATRLFQGALKGTILPRTRLDQGARNALTAGVGYTGILIAALIAINSAGIDLSGLAIVAGGLSLGIGFGMQNIVSNFVSGIILLIERPVSEGDWIEVGGAQGIVKSISVRSTRIQTFDRTDVIVPNTDLVAGKVTNWTRFSLSGRLIVPIGVAFGTDTRKVERILREIAEAQPMTLMNPPPLVALMGFGPDSMNFEIRVIIRDVNFSLAVRTEINHQIVERFAAEGVEIPFAQSEITIRNANEIAAMLRETRQAAAATSPAAGPGAALPMRPDMMPGEGLVPQAGLSGGYGTHPEDKT